MFAELEAAALRSYPRAVSLEDRFADLLPEVMLGVDAERFSQIAAIAFTPRPVPTVGTEHLHEVHVSVPDQAQAAAVVPGAAWDRAVGVVFRSDRRVPAQSRSSAASWRCSNCFDRGR